MKSKFKAVKYLYLISLISGVGAFASAETVDVRVNDIPSRVLVSEVGVHNGKQGLISREVGTTSRREITVSIPKRYIVKDSSGVIDLKESLNKWGREAAKAREPNAPVWTSSGVYFPYSPVSSSKTYYVPLINVIDNISNTPGTMITTSGEDGLPILLAGSADAMSVNRVKYYNGQTVDNGKKGPSKNLSTQEWQDRYDEIRKNRVDKNAKSTKVDVPTADPNSNISHSNSAIANQVRALANQGSVTCNKTSNAGHCMLCNCMQESIGEPEAGQIAVGRVTITRFERKGFPDSICGVVWSGSQRSSGSAFSWTMEAERSPKRFSAGEVRTCAASTLKAIELGGWAFDHFYANKGLNAISAPSWARDYASRRTPQQVGNHLFLNSGRSVVQSFRSQNQTQTVSADSAERGLQ